MLRVSLEIFRKGSILTVTSIANIVNARGIYMSNGTGLLVGVSLRRPLFGNSWFFHLHYILMCLCLLGGSGLQEVPALRGFKSPPDRIPAFHWILLWGFPLCVPPAVSSSSSQPTQLDLRKQVFKTTHHLLLLLPICIGNLEWKWASVVNFILTVSAREGRFSTLS